MSNPPVQENRNERPSRAILNSTQDEGYTRNGAGQREPPYREPQLPFAHGLDHPLDAGPRDRTFRTQADREFFTHHATGPKWNYLLSRRLPGPPPRQDSLPPPELAYNPPPWNVEVDPNNQHVAHGRQPPPDHVFTNSTPQGATRLAPLDPEEQQYWREAKGSSYRETLVPDHLVAENQYQTLNAHRLEQFHGAFDVGGLWGERWGERGGRV